MRPLWGVLLLAGCAAVKVQTHQPKTPLTVAAMVVYPVKLTGWAAPDWRTFEVGQRAVSAVLGEASSRLQIFGPTEFQVMKWEDDSWVGCTALPQLIKSGVLPAQAVILRIAVEKRVASSTHEARDAKGRARGASALEETTWVGHAEVLAPADRQVLVEVDSETHTDPFQEAPPEAEFDPAPALTQLVERLASEATRRVLASAGDKVGPPEVVLLAESPALTAGFPDREVASFDALTAELWLQNRARYLTPSLTDAQAAKVAKQPPGLWVVKAPTAPNVESGDLIVKVDGAPASGAVLARKRLQATPVQVRVRRGAQEFDTTIP
jgi:hypothetical protein